MGNINKYQGIDYLELGLHAAAPPRRAPLVSVSENPRAAARIFFIRCGLGVLKTVLRIGPDEKHEFDSGGFGLS
jgi:hypothetical protein